MDSECFNMESDDVSLNMKIHPRFYNETNKDSNVNQSMHMHAGIILTIYDERYKLNSTIMMDKIK
jgi:hypothetical protein